MIGLFFSFVLMCQIEPDSTPLRIDKQPRVQLLLFTADYCEISKNLEKAIRTDGQLAFYDGHDFSRLKSGQVRLVDVTIQETERRRHNVTKTPTLIFIVDGISIETKERDPKKLAKQWYRYDKELAK